MQGHCVVILAPSNHNTSAQAPVVQSVDNAIQQIYHYYIQWISLDKTNAAIHWIVIYPVDSNRGQAAVVLSIDNAIHRINHYPVDKSWISFDTTNAAIHWIVIYPVDSIIHPFNNQGQEYKLHVTQGLQLSQHVRG